VDLLPPDLRAFVRKDLLLKAWRKVGQIDVSRGGGDGHVVAFPADQLNDQVLGPRCSGGDDLRPAVSLFKTYSELDVVPSFVEVVPSG